MSPLADSIPASGPILATASIVLLLSFAYVCWPSWRLNWLRWTLVAITILLPPCLIAATILTAPSKLGDVRLTLEHVDLNLAAFTRHEASIGGDAINDTLAVSAASAAEPGMQPKALSIRRAGDGAALTFNRPRAGQPVGMVAAGLPLATASLPGSSRIAPGQFICIANRPIRFEADAGGLSVAGQRAFLPLQKMSKWRDGSFPVYPVKYYAARTAQDLKSGWLTHVTSFLFRQGDDVFVALLDANSFVSTDSRCAAPVASVSPVLSLAAGQTIHLEFLAVSTAESWQVEDWFASAPQRAARGWFSRLISAEPLPPGSRLEDRRGMTLTAGIDGQTSVLGIDFNTPEAASLPAELLKAALQSPTLIQDERVRIAFGGLADAAPPRLQNSRDPAWDMLQGSGRLDQVVFRTLGETQREGLLQRLEFDNRGGFLFAEKSCTGEHSTSILRHAFGEKICLASTYLTPRIAVDRIDLGWPPFSGLLLLPFAMALAGFISSGRWRFESPFAFIILALADFLLAMRLLIATEGVVIDPRPTLVLGVRASLLAIAVVPFLLSGLQICRARSNWGRTWPGLALHAGLAATGAAILALQPPLALSTAGALVLLAGLVIALRYLPQGIGTKRLARARAYVQERPIILLWVISLVLGGGRAFVSERWRFGGASVVFMPFYVLFAAYVLDFATTRPRRMHPLLNWLSAYVLLGLPLLGTMAGGDKGYALTHIMPLVLWAALLALWLPRSSGAAKLGLSLPAILIVGLLAAASYWATMPTQTAWPAAEDVRHSAIDARLKIVEDSVAARPWQLRLAAFARPEQLSESGTLASEGLSSALAQMREYGSRGAWGVGYLNQRKPTELLRYHMDDNVAAVHLLAPFGRLGVAAFMAALLAACACCSWLVAAERGGNAPTYLQSAGLLALWTLGIVSVYMILANLLVVPFTGRNIFLLSPISPSDLIEGVVLLGLALYTLDHESAL